MSTQCLTLLETLTSAAASRLPELDWSAIRLVPADFDKDFGYARGAGAAVALAELNLAVASGEIPPGIVLLGLANDAELPAGLHWQAQMQALTAWSGFRYLRMPFTVEELDQAVRAVLAGRSAPTPAVTAEEVATIAADIRHWFERVVQIPGGTATILADVARGELELPRRNLQPEPCMEQWHRNEFDRLYASLLLCPALADGAALANGLREATAELDAASSLLEHKRAAVRADSRQPDQATLLDLAAAARMLAEKARAMFDRIGDIASQADEGAKKQR